MTAHRALKAFAGVYLILLVLAVLSYKAAFMGVMFSNSVFFGIYSVAVVTYILSRFIFSLFYRSKPDAGIEPPIAIVMPAFNEEEAIAASLHALLALDYPREKLELIAVNDGSTDNTLAEHRARRRGGGGTGAGDRLPREPRQARGDGRGHPRDVAEVIVFVDSDSVVEPDALKLVQPLADPRVGAVCGHANVLNVGETWLTRMQAVRYFVAFRVVKAAESVFNAVTCCSGCFSAYRREAILPRMEWWENQRSSASSRPSATIAH